MKWLEADGEFSLVGKLRYDSLDAPLRRPGPISVRVTNNVHDDLPLALRCELIHGRAGLGDALRWSGGSFVVAARVKVIPFGVVDRHAGAPRRVDVRSDGWVAV